MRGLLRRRGTPSRGHRRRGLTGRPSRERRRRRPTAAPLVARMWRGRRVGASAEDGDVREADPSPVEAAPEETLQAEGGGAA